MRNDRQVYFSGGFRSSRRIFVVKRRADWSAWIQIGSVVAVAIAIVEILKFL